MIYTIANRERVEAIFEAGQLPRVPKWKFVYPNLEMVLEKFEGDLLLTSSIYGIDAPWPPSYHLPHDAVLIRLPEVEAILAERIRAMVEHEKRISGG